MPIDCNPDDLVTEAMSALASREDCHSLFEEMPVPLYTTDATGIVTYCNPAAAAFAGRDPRPGSDRWCVTYKLYSTSGEYLPHEQCPMAEALQTKRPVRNRVAVAERPDGSRVAFKPYPTPILDEEEEVIGGFNILVDITEEQEAALAAQADRCRRLSRATYDRATSSALDSLADGYSKTAEDLRQNSKPAIVKV